MWRAAACVLLIVACAVTLLVTYINVDHPKEWTPHGFRDLSHRKVIACSPIYNEIDILKFKMKELWDQVDMFMVVEANLTHAGKEKPLYITEAKDELKEFQDKLHICVLTYPDELKGTMAGRTDWRRERMGRYQMYVECQKLNLHEDDIVVMTDLDEVIDPALLQKLRQHMPQDGVVNVSPHWFNYGWDNYLGMWNYTMCVSTWGAFQHMVQSDGWSGRQLFTNHKGYFVKYDRFGHMGWHVSYFMSLERILKKMQIQFSMEGHNARRQSYIDDPNILINDIMKGRCNGRYRTLFQAHFPKFKHLLQDQPT